MSISEEQNWHGGESVHALGGALLDAGNDGSDFEELHTECGFRNRKSTLKVLGLLSRGNGYAVVGTDASLMLALLSVPPHTSQRSSMVLEMGICYERAIRLPFFNVGEPNIISCDAHITGLVSTSGKDRR